MASVPAGARPKGRIVPSRYLQYDKKNAGKTQADSSRSVPKGPEKGTSAKRPPAQLQKQESTLEMPFRVLQSTVLEDHGNARPDLELSVIKDKSRPVMPRSKPNPAVKGTARRQKTVRSPDTEDLIQRLDSQMLLLTYASVKMEKNLALLGGKAEKNLLVLLEERERLQEEIHGKKRRLLRLKQEQQLSAALDRQMEVLVPVAEKCAKFQEDYKHFATALDSTRHELPVKGIRLGEDQGHDLGALQEHLTATQNLLKQNLQEHSEHNAQALAVVKELEEAAVKLSDELPRSFAAVLNLSAAVSKEVSLHHQKMCEDTLGLEAIKQYYRS